MQRDRTLTRTKYS